MEVWGSFRVAKRGHPHVTEYEPLDHGFKLEAWHDSYLRLPSKPAHWREFRWRDSGRLEITDHVTANNIVLIVNRLHLHPDCRIQSQSEYSVLVDFPLGTFRIVYSGDGDLEVEESLYFPQFGIAQNNKTIKFVSRGDDVKTVTSIELIK